MTIDPHQAFSLAGTAAMLGWLALLATLAVPAVRRHAFAAAGILIPAILAVAYVILLAEGFGAAEGGGFGSIGQVRALFANDAALAAGWLHYLAFDLFVGAWIVREGLRRGVPRLLILLCLPLTFLAGPAGLLLFLLLRLPFRPKDADA
jgi:hypothetical protein